jgi:hypothetical protein
VILQDESRMEALLKTCTTRDFIFENVLKV